MAAHVVYVKRAGSLVAVNVDGCAAEFGELPNVLNMKGPQLPLSVPSLVSPSRRREVKQGNLENWSDSTDSSHFGPRSRCTISISSTASLECSLQNQQSSSGTSDSESSMDFAHVLGWRKASDRAKVQHPGGS